MKEEEFKALIENFEEAEAAFKED